MKLINYLYNDKANIGVLKGDYIYPTEFSDLYSLIERYSVEDLNMLKLMDKIYYKDVKPLPIIQYPRQDILCAGMNYKNHKQECIAANIDFDKNLYNPKSVYFSKRCNKAVTTNDVISLHQDITSEVDYEGELGIIFGRDASNIKSEEEALNTIFGYTIINDVSARDLQKEHQQFYFGKSLDGFTSIAPVVVTRDEFKGFPSLNLKTYVNDELRQDNSTDNLIFTIPQMIIELTRGITLLKGTIFSTGTPSGIGKGFNPPKMLKSGDKVRIIIEGIGELINTFK